MEVTMQYRGVWEKHRTDVRGITITHAGSLWLAEDTTDSKPGTDGSWKLIVKNGSFNDQRELLIEAEAMIDQQWRTALVSLKADMRALGVTEEGFAAMRPIKRSEWRETKKRQLAEVAEWFRNRLN